MSFSVIVTCSYIKSHPSIKLVKRVIESLNKTGIKKNTPIILSHDYSDNPNYELYLKNLNDYIENKPNIKIVRRETHGHLVGNIRNAFNYIYTEYVLIVQHDFEFIRKFYIKKIIEDMQNNVKVKHIRFNKRITKSEPRNMDRKRGKGYVTFGDQLKCKNYTYTQTPGWSDNNHLVASSYYREIILPKCKDGKPMERHFKCEKDHSKYGTYIFGKINDYPYILHLDGRNTI